MKFFAELREYGAYIALFCGDKKENGTWIAKPVEFERQPNAGLSVDEPMLRLDWEDAQRLADELWQAGVRPTQGKQSEGVTGAQTRHLDDMRAIVFHKLGIKTGPNGQGSA